MFNDRKDEAKLRAYALKSGAFESRKTAFDYFFIFEGRTVEEAERLSAMLASARGVPDHPEPPEGPIDKAKRLIGQCTQLAGENPRMADILIGLVTGAVTSLTGVAIGAKTATGDAPGPSNEIDTNATAIELDNGKADTI